MFKPDLELLGQIESRSNTLSNLIMKNSLNVINGNIDDISVLERLENKCKKYEARFRSLNLLIKEISCTGIYPSLN
jgi:hydroxyethylthiazole kinase-like sugar kinase family protein